MPSRAQAGGMLDAEKVGQDRMARQHRHVSEFYCRYEEKYCIPFRVRGVTIAG